MILSTPLRAVAAVQVRAAMRTSGTALQWASRDAVLGVVACDGDALRWATRAMREDVEVVPNSRSHVHFQTFGRIEDCGDSGL